MTATFLGLAAAAWAGFMAGSWSRGRIWESYHDREVDRLAAGCREVLEQMEARHKADLAALVARLEALAAREGITLPGEKGGRP